MLMSGNLTWPVKSRRLGQIFVGVNNQDKSDCAPEPRGALLSQNDLVERVMGIEPTLFAWEARVLPLNDTRDGFIVGFSRHEISLLVASGNMLTSLL